MLIKLRLIQVRKVIRNYEILFSSFLKRNTLLLVMIQQYIDNSYKDIRKKYEAKQIVNNIDFIVVASLGLHTYNDYYIQVHIH